MSSLLDVRAATMTRSHIYLAQVSKGIKVRVVKCPFLCGGFVPRPIGLVNACDFWDEWFVVIRVGEQGAD